MWGTTHHGRKTGNDRREYKIATANKRNSWYEKVPTSLEIREKPGSGSAARFRGHVVRGRKRFIHTSLQGAGRDKERDLEFSQV